MVSSAFVVWTGEGPERKGRFVINFHHQNRHWPKGSVKLETVLSFALDMEKGYFRFSIDVKSGYLHLYLHLDMRDYFMFRYGGRFFKFVARPFGWGRSGLWFVRFMCPFVRHLREKLGYGVFPYIDDFLLAPSRPRRASTEEDAERARGVLERLFRWLGRARNPTKGCWEGGRRVEHLGILTHAVD